MWPSRPFCINPNPKGPPRFVAREKDLGQGARILTKFCSLVSIHIYLAFKHMHFFKISKQNITPLIDTPYWVISSKLAVFNEGRGH